MPHISQRQIREMQKMKRMNGCEYFESQEGEMGNVSLPGGEPVLEEAAVGGSLAASVLPLTVDGYTPNPTAQRIRRKTK